MYHRDFYFVPLGVGAKGGDTFWSPSVNDKHRESFSEEGPSWVLFVCFFLSKLKGAKGTRRPEVTVLRIMNSGLLRAPSPQFVKMKGNVKLAEA